MNKAFIPTSPPRPLCASNQNTLHCHQSGTEREQELTPRLILSILSLTGCLTFNTCEMDNVSVRDVLYCRMLSGNYAVDRPSLRVGRTFA